MNLLTPPPNRVPFTDDDGLPGIWANWFALLEVLFNTITGTGTTANRPNPAPYIGYMYFDTTVNKPIWAKTLTTWVYADGTAA